MGKTKGDAGMTEVDNRVHLNIPIGAYAAWSNDEATRLSSASGGIATTLYQYALDNDMLIVGAYMNDKFECRLKLSDNADDIELFQNSKYTYSYAEEIYKQIAQKLKAGQRVLFIGLPCQVAALKRYLETIRLIMEDLFTVDLICHGTPGPYYLKEHITAIEKINSSYAKKCYFRDPQYRTQKFVFSIYDRLDNLMYRGNVNGTDLYQIGYHKALIYRDSCYACKFAQINRPGDLTIGDFHVRDVDECDIDIENVSLILVNTDKGRQFLSAAVADKRLSVLERDLQEPIQGEKQLRHPSVAGSERDVFLTEYRKRKDYEIAASIAFKKIVLKRRLKVDEIILYVKKTIKALIPASAWKYAKLKLKSYE